MHFFYAYTWPFVDVENAWLKSVRLEIDKQVWKILNHRHFRNDTDSRLNSSPLPVVHQRFADWRQSILSITEMWTNAQRDGRPAEYRWRPLFNATKFGWRPLLQCRAVTLLRRETHWNVLGCPKLVNRFQPLVGWSSPYCEDMQRRYCCLTIFSDCRYVP